MILSRILLQHFRHYESANFSFDKDITYIIGPNTAGKSNLMEAIYVLSYGKSFRTENDGQMMQFSTDITRAKAKVISNLGEETIVEVVFAEPSLTGNIRSKRYLVNDIPKRKTDFIGTFSALLFEPSDLDLVSGAPSLRREFLDEVLEQTDRDYRHALLSFNRALKQRNALLRRAQETGMRDIQQFMYWDDLLITAGNTITQKREDLITYINDQKKALFSCSLAYDKSVISAERLSQYADAELGAGVTLVGPHRDDVQILMESLGRKEPIAIKSYGSRGQQRLAVLQLKLLQLVYMREHLAEQPVLLLDDIFSELDDMHINHILEMIHGQQTIITTTHKEFIKEVAMGKMIELENNRIPMD